MPVLRHFWSFHRTIVVIGLLGVCIVTTVGVVRAGAGKESQTFSNEKIIQKADIVMGHKSATEQLIAAEDEEDEPVKPETGFIRKGYEFEKDLEERLLAKRGDKKNNKQQELKDPHPYLSIPQLPFCKPTKTTIGSAAKPTSSEESEKTSGDKTGDFSGKDESIGSHEYHEDIEVINTGEGVLETDRKFLVATLDGKVTLLNKTGHQLWSVKTGPLFSSTISSLQLNENGKSINLIPSLTGAVYKYDGDSLHPMPFNADSLLKKSFKLSNDVAITGGKELRTFGIDVKSGTVRYECGIAGCVIPGDSEVNTSDNTSEESVVLVIKKQMQTVRAIDSMSGIERWNFSVGTHEMALAGVTEGCYHGEQRDHSKRASDFIKIAIPEGRVFGADRENRIVWDQQFEAPISQAWILEGGQLVSVDPITNTPLTDVPSLYIGLHDQQLYVQESQSTAGKMEKYFGVDDSSLSKKPLNIAWKPANAIDGASGSTALTTISPSNKWVSFSLNPNFRPMYVFEKDSIGDPLDDSNDSDEEDSEDSNEFDDEALNFSDGITQVIVMSLWFWWKEVLGISLLTAVLLNLILMKPIMRAVRSQTIREMSVYFQQLWNRWKEEEESRALLARHSSNLLSLPAPVENNSIEENRKRSTSTSSTGSLNSPSSEDREIPFSSQYLNEFIPIECLGRGGFGVVFEAKKKIDDRTYAVKRITLPDREKARVRVMREVKALAQLDHRNIVRYFNAWIECPPPGWLEKNDPLWAKTIISSTSPTMDYPSDLLGSSAFPKTSKTGNKADHAKISVPNTPSEHPNDDSFIVFESSSTSTFSKISYSLEKSPIGAELEDTSICIPASEENSTASSVSGVGFFAQRPTSLNIHSNFSNLSSFHEDSSQKPLLALNPFSEDDKSENEHDKEAVPLEDCSNVMYLYIQQELCQKRTLQDWLRSERNRNLFQVVNLFSQIVEAVEYFHSKKLIHRDLKPSNIFLAEVTENGHGILTVKIGDFGLATYAYAEIEAEKIASTPLDENGSTQPVKINLTGHVGTHLYMSPEQYHRKPYDYKVDIYSLGLIFFELLVPFSTDMERYNSLSGVRKVNFPDKFKDDFLDEYDLIRTMISHNPNERPDATQINTWVKRHILKMPGTATTSNTRGSGDAFVGRSVSSPAEIVIDSGDSSSETKKLKPRFYKTQSVM